jgi:hypothetical protein
MPKKGYQKIQPAGPWIFIHPERTGAIWISDATGLNTI